MAANGVPMFSEEQKKTLNECGNFAVALQRCVTQLLADGCTNVVLPQFPKSELLTILNGDAGEKKKSKLQGAELDEYLRNQLVGVAFNEPDLQDIADIVRNTPMAIVVEKLKKGL